MSKKSANTLNSKYTVTIKVSLTSLPELPAVDFVEDLHEYECVEDHCVVEARVVSPHLVRPLELNAKQDASPEE